MKKLPAIVLFHAQGTDRHSFDRVAKRLAKKFRVFAIDYCGHGIHVEKPREFVKAIFSCYL